MIQPKVFTGRPVGPSLNRLKELVLIDHLLRDPDQFFGEIGQGSGLREKMRAMLLRLSLRASASGSCRPLIGYQRR